MYRVANVQNCLMRASLIIVHACARRCWTVSRAATIDEEGGRAAGVRLEAGPGGRGAGSCLEEGGDGSGEAAHARGGGRGESCGTAGFQGVDRRAARRSDKANGGGVGNDDGGTTAREVRRAPSSKTTTVQQPATVWPIELKDRPNLEIYNFFK